MQLDGQNQCIRGFRTLWIMQAPLLVFTACVFLRMGFQFEWRQTLIGFAQLCVLILAATVLLHTRSAWKVGAAFTALAQYFVFFLSMVMFSHSVAILNFPYFDGPLLHFDRSIGYDWRAYVAYAADHPLLAASMRAAYKTILWQPIFVIVALISTNRGGDLIAYLIAAFIALIACISIFAFLPVTTAWVFTGAVNEVGLKTLVLAGTDHGWVHQLLELRAGRGRVVPWNVDSGIVGFPSFHAAAAILNCFAMRRARNLKYCFLALNALMLAATPLFGGHYLADIFAGILIAAASIYLAAKILPFFTAATIRRIPIDVHIPMPSAITASAQAGT